MIEQCPYQFKKIYLDDEIFEDSSNEIKVGYLNINGLLEGNHLSYLDSDKNLTNLQILVLAETKLLPSSNSASIESQLKNWTILNRFDADSGKKNMGLIVLSPTRYFMKQIEGNYVSQGKTEWFSSNSRVDCKIEVSALSWICIL